MDTSKIYCAFTAIILLLVSVGCESEDDLNIYSQPKPNVPDTTIYVSSLPSNIKLFLGKSVRIQNAVTTFMFYSIVSDTRLIINNEVVGNAKIYMHLDYGSFQRYVELNTNELPGSYSLENGLQYSISLKDVQSIDSTYQIVFQFNEYKDW